MNLKNVRIDMVSPCRGRVYIDGLEVENVTALRFDARVGEVNRLTLKINVGRGDITGLADVARTYSPSYWRQFMRWIRRAENTGE